MYVNPPAPAASGADSAPAGPRRIHDRERCDRCSAQAFARATVQSVDLHFCGHHFTEHEEVLYGSASEIVDERRHINVRPSLSASPT